MLLLLGLAPVVWAAPDFAERFTVDRWTIDDGGLPQNSVFSIVQARDGYLWLGTLNGLVRFDGLRFTVYDESNIPGLTSSRILHVFEDREGNLWVGTERGGALLITTEGRVIPVRIGDNSLESRLMSIQQDSQGAVWMYAADGQLYRYRDRQMNVWSVGHEQPSRARLLLAERDGLMWCGTDASLQGWDPREVRSGEPLPFKYRLPVRTKLDFLLARAEGGYWRCADGTVQLWSANRLVRDLGPYPWATNTTIMAACEDASGNLVVGLYGEPGDGVHVIDPNGAHRALTGLARQSVLSVTTDREGNLWVGTDGEGLHRVQRPVFDVLEGTLGSAVQSVCVDAGGGVWVGYNAEKVEYWKDGQRTEYAVRRPPVNLAVRAVLVDRREQVWVGTYNGGVFRLVNGGFEPDPGYDDIGNPRVTALHEDASGRIWVGSEGGLARWDGQRWRTFSTFHGLAGNAVRGIASDSAGNLWVGSDGAGLARLGPETASRFTATNGLPGNFVTSLHGDAEGILWVGTSSGMARFDGSKWLHFGVQDGMAGNSIRYLLDDHVGDLWIGSNAGLMRGSRAALGQGANSSNLAFRVYGRADGLPSRECSQGSQPSAWRGPDGRLWFATIRGLASVQPSSLRVNTNPPPVRIEAILLDGEQKTAGSVRAPQPQEIVVPPAAEALEIRYTSLNLARPEQGRFMYRLEGLETAWTERPGDERSARYSRLPQGTYTFHVKARNEDGVWNQAGVRLRVVVQPPFYRTWWFLLLSALTLLGMVAGSVYYVSTQKLQRQLAFLRQKEALERERSRIARDLHDQLGANLTQVALLGEMVEEDKEMPAEVESHARQIAGTARETTRSLDEIVWTVNPANDTLDGLANYVCKYAQDYLALAGLKYRLEVPPDLPNTPISPDLRHNLFLSAKEAINNVVKHAQASSAWVRIRLDPASFTLEIADDGKGLSPEALEKGRNGLKNMRRRMEDVGGSFELQPNPGGGTVIRLVAPRGSAPKPASP